MRNILPLELEEEEEEEGEEEGEEKRTGEERGEGGIETREGGGMLASRKALHKIAPRTAHFLKKFRKLNEALVEVIEDYNMVSFVPVSCRDMPSLHRLIKACDKATAFIPTAQGQGRQQGGGREGGGGGGRGAAKEGEGGQETEEEEEGTEEEEEETREEQDTLI